jgi:hypothetical protein
MFFTTLDNSQRKNSNLTQVHCWQQVKTVDNGGFRKILSGYRIWFGFTKSDHLVLVFSRN